MLAQDMLARHHGEARICFRALKIDSSFQARFFQASLKYGKLASELREFTSA